MLQPNPNAKKLDKIYESKLNENNEGKDSNNNIIDKDIKTKKNLKKVKRKKRK